MYDFNCCRVCLSYDNLVLIFDTDSSQKISHKITYVTGKDVIEQSGFPNKICSKCLQYLNIAYSFKTVYETTTLKLLELFERETVRILANLEYDRQNITPVIVKKTVDDDFRESKDDSNTSKNRSNEIKNDITSNVTFSCDSFIDDITSINEVLVYTETVEDNLKLLDISQTNKVGRHTARKNSNTHPKKLKLSEDIKYDGIQIVEKRLSPVELSNQTLDRPKIISLTCDVCSKTFPFQSHLVRHLNTHNTVKKYKCKHCGKLFTNKYNLKSHLRQHTDDYPLRCKKCSKGFSSPSILKRHMLGHSSISKFECRYCGKKVTHRSSLIMHEKMHVEDGTLFKCQECSKLFKYKNSLSAHVRKVH